MPTPCTLPLDPPLLCDSENAFSFCFFFGTKILQFDRCDDMYSEMMSEIMFNLIKVEEVKGRSKILKWGVNFCNNVREIK